jgi:hypothetical protein
VVSKSGADSKPQDVLVPAQHMNYTLIKKKTKFCKVIYEEGIPNTEEMRKYLTKYEEAVSHTVQYMTLKPISFEFSMKNFFFYISVHKASPSRKFHPGYYCISL